MSASFNTQIFLSHLANKITIASQARVMAGSAAPKSAAPVELGAITFPNNMKMRSSVIAIGASTGGTEATLAVLKQLPADSPGIVITQHMPEGFTKMYAERLNRLCKIEVREAKSGDKI